jgi:uncharacterized protein involved in exopolysaccharide biosynthesis
MLTFDMRMATIVASKYMLRAVTVFLFFILLAVAVCLLMKRQYTATANVLVKVGRELVYHSDTTTNDLPLPSVDKDAVVASTFEIMGDPDIKRHIIQTIGLAKMYPQLAPGAPGDESLISVIMHAPAAAIQSFFGMDAQEDPMAEAVRLFTRKLSLDLIKKTSIITVSFTHPDPQIAAEVANMVVSEFQKRAGDIYDDPNLGFLEKDVAGQRAALAAAEGKLNAYEQQYGVYSFDNQLNMLLQQKNTLDTSIKDAEAHVVELQDMVAALKAERAATPASVALSTSTERHAVVDATETSLLAMRLQEKQLASRYQSTYQPLIDLREQIKLAQQSLATQRSDRGGPATTGVNVTYQLIDQQLLARQAELTSVFGRLEVMKAQQTAVSDAMATLSSRQRELLDLQHDVDLRNAAVATSYTKLAQARAVSGLNALQSSSFKLYQPAIAPDLADPSRPKPVLYLALAMVLGIVGGSAVIFFSYLFNNSFITPEQASLRLGLPTLAVISYQRRFARAAVGRSSRGGAMRMPVARADQAPA